MRPGLGVIVGRFQVPDLHAGHHGIIHEALKHQRTLVLIGINPNMGTPTDPLDYPSRERMIKSHYPEVMVAPLKDQPTDEGWSLELDAIIEAHHPIGEVVLYAGRDSFSSHYFGEWKVKETETITDTSGSEIRDTISQVVLGSQDFRQGIIYSCLNQFPKVFLTVDMAVVKLSLDSTYPDILVGRKAQDPKDEWRFPGGFVNSKDSCILHAARRELYEETQMTSDAAFIDLGVHKVRDWRHPNDRISAIFTNLFVVRYLYGAPVAGDDLSEVRWVPAPELERWTDGNNLTEGHANLAKKVISWCKTNAYRKNTWELKELVTS